MAQTSDLLFTPISLYVDFLSVRTNPVVWVMLISTGGKKLVEFKIINYLEVKYVTKINQKKKKKLNY